MISKKGFETGFVCVLLVVFKFGLIIFRYLVLQYTV